jgi:hypothetical protein
MTEHNRKHITRRLHAHTVRVMLDCADRGHGCDHGRALRSASRLMELIEEVIKHESLIAHSAGYAERTRDLKREANP